jgi:hypothetical protein
MAEAKQAISIDLGLYISVKIMSVKYG